MNRFNTKGKRTYNISEIIVGDIVKFKGTRNKGFRKILSIDNVFGYNIATDKYENYNRYMSQVLTDDRTFKPEPYTSTNSVDKLSHVFRDGTWFKVIKDGN